VKSIEIITKAFADAIVDGNQMAKTRKEDEMDEMKEKMETNKIKS